MAFSRLPALEVQHLNIPAVQEAGRRRAEGQRRSQIFEREQAAKAAWPAARRGDPAAESAYEDFGYEYATRLKKWKDGASATEREEAARQGELSARLAMSVRQVQDPIQQRMAYQAAYEGAQRAGLDVSEWPQVMPEHGSPEYQQLMARLDVVIAEGMTTAQYARLTGEDEGPAGASGPTGSQQSANAEIDMDRRLLEDRFAGLDPSTIQAEILRMTKETDPVTMLPNPDYDPNIARRVRSATQRKVNVADPEFERINQLYYGETPPGIPGRGLGEGAPIVSQPGSAPDPNVILPTPASGAGLGPPTPTPAPVVGRVGRGPRPPPAPVGGHPGGPAGKATPGGARPRQRVPTKAGGSIDVSALEVGQVYEFADGSAAIYIGDEMFEAVTEGGGGVSKNPLR